MYPCSAHIVTIVPHRSPLLLLLCPYIIIVMSALIMLWPLRLLYIERRSFHLYHPRIVHLCNVKEVSPSKRLNSKALIYLFYLFLSWFHNRSLLQNTKYSLPLWYQGKRAEPSWEEYSPYHDQHYKSIMLVEPMKYAYWPCSPGAYIGTFGDMHWIKYTAIHKYIWLIW